MITFAPSRALVAGGDARVSPVRFSGPWSSEVEWCPYPLQLSPLKKKMSLSAAKALKQAP